MTTARDSNLIALKASLFVLCPHVVCSSVLFRLVVLSLVSGLLTSQVVVVGGGGRHLITLF